MSMKKFIKNNILHNGYSCIYNISPLLANIIRDKLYYLSHILKYGHLLAVKGSLSRTHSSILIDVTRTTIIDEKTGIQRVVNNIFDNLRLLSDNVYAIRVTNKQVITSQRYLAQHFDYKFNGIEKKVNVIENDNLLLLDSSWGYYKKFIKVIDDIQTNINIYAVVYDLLPIQYPYLFSSNAGISNFISWHNMVLQKADTILCISKTTADNIIKYFIEHKIKRNKALKIYVFHLGCNFMTSTKITARFKIKKFVSKMPTFLMVGTIEPRKGHICVLNAFEQILKSNCTIQLLVIGKIGWKSEEFINKLENSKILQKNIMWIDNADDEELYWCYQHTKALIIASQDEGYGLPIIEAAHFVLPIICSDIQIFREVAGNNATYFKKMDVEDLKETILNWLQEENHPDSYNIKLYTWRESAQEVLDIINDKVKPYKTLY